MSLNVAMRVVRCTCKQVIRTSDTAAPLAVMFSTSGCEMSLIASSYDPMVPAYY